MQTLRNLGQNPKFIFGVFFLNLNVWLLIILPTLYFKGPAHCLVSLKSSPYSFVFCLTLFCSLALVISYLMLLATHSYLGKLVPSEKRSIVSNFFKDNPPLQLIIIIFAESDRNSVEALI
jgi:hypothetical protein